MHEHEYALPVLPEAIHWPMVQARLNLTRVVLTICLLSVLTFVTTSVKSSLAFRDKGNEKHPIPIPYWIPFLGNLIPFLWDPAGFCSWTT